MKYLILIIQVIFLSFATLLQAADVAFLANLKPDPKKDLSRGGMPEALIELGNQSWLGPLRLPGSGINLIQPPSGAVMQIFKLPDGKIGVRDVSGKIQALDMKNDFDKEVLRDLGRFILSRGLYGEGDGKLFLKAYFDIDVSPQTRDDIKPSITLEHGSGTGTSTGRPVVRGTDATSLLSLLTEPQKWEAISCTKKECVYQSKDLIFPKAIKMGGAAKLLVEAPVNHQPVVATGVKKEPISKADTSLAHNDFLKKAKAEKKTVIIMLGNVERCPPCRDLHTAVESGNLSADEGLAVLYLDADKVFDHGYNLAGGIPKVIIRHPETGNIAEQMPGGGMTADSLRDKLKALGLRK